MPACVQADHVGDEALIKAALASGVGAVLADGSRRPWDANVALARGAVQLAPANVGVEAELGHIEGSEDIAWAAAAGAFTDPAKAAGVCASNRGRLSRCLDWERPRDLRLDTKP